MALEIQRIYEDDGSKKKHYRGETFRIFVDRLWARGINKEEANIDLWLKDIAPSDKLRSWFGHDPGKWNQFKERYFKELDGKKEAIELILQKLHSGCSVFLLYGAKDEKFNNAAALKEYLLRKLDK
ncbi:MAG: DUF488 family protein [Thermoproteota archaeon]|jgi:uncharacterized protein YeaO (DUF488 family)|nr:DUF488 family protein [Thermoproteota archaeon]